jgi:hypothetical protein
MARDKVHRPYFKADGTQVPGVTTLTRIWNSSGEAFTYAAWKLGTEGKDYKKVWEEKAAIGTLAHAMIMTELSRVPLRDEYLKDFTPNQVDAAENAALSAFSWMKGGYNLEEFVLETATISEMMGFGGTPDFYGKVNGTWTVLDFKTGNELYDDMWAQLAGYALSIIESGRPVNQLMLVSAPRAESLDYAVKTLQEWGDMEAIFLSCLQIHQAYKEFKVKKKEARQAIKKAKKEKKNE